MKQANKTHLTLIVLPIILCLILDYVLKRQGINFLTSVQSLDVMTSWIIAIAAFGLLVIPSLLWTVNRTHVIYVKRLKNQPLKQPRLLLFLSVLIVGYGFILLDLTYYEFVLIGFMLLLILIYYIALRLFDKHYIHSSQKSQLSFSDDLIVEFITQFGDEANIESVSFEHSRLKVEVKDTRRVNLEGLKELGASGVFVAGKKIQAFVGNDAQKLENLIKRYLTRG